MIRITELKLPLSAVPVETRRAADAPTETDADRVDESNQDGGPDERGELLPRDRRGAVDLGPGGAGEEPDQPAGDTPAVIQEEDQREEREEGAGDEVGRGQAGLRGGRAEAAPGRDRGLQLLEVGRELAVGDVEGAADPLADLVQAGGFGLAADFFVKVPKA